MQTGPRLAWPGPVSVNGLVFMSLALRTFDTLVVALVFAALL